METLVKEIGMKTLATNKLRPNDYNPNRMTDSEFAEFVAEIKHLGRLPKPIVVRSGNDDEFIIIDGEHALKAAKAVGLAEVDCEVVVVDDFEAMRQTYKRNQHGTHNKILLGQMFQRMAKERGLSLRNLAKEVEVSDGTIRNAFEYTKAVKVRNSYAGDGEDTEGKIASLSLRQVRYYNRLPEKIANLWLDSGAEIITLFPSWNREPTEADIEQEAGKSECSVSELLNYHYKEIEKSGLLQYVRTVRDSRSFIAAIKQVYDWESWENKYCYHFSNIGWFSREEFRKYASYYYKGIWPFSGDRDWMEYALNMLIEPGDESSPTCFRLTPEEFDAVVEQVNQYAKKQQSRTISFDTFQDYFRLVIYEKTGKKVDAKCDVQEKLMQATIENEAPDYIRESKLCLFRDKKILWETVELLQQKHPEQKSTIEQIARPMAEQEFLPGPKEGEKSKEEAVRNFILRHLFAAEQESKRESASNIELAMEIADLCYARETQKDGHERMSLKLAQLEKEELIRLHGGMLYCQNIRRMRETLNHFGGAASFFAKT